MGDLTWNAFALAVIIVLMAPTAGAATDPPLVGCYERVYDVAHLAAHKKQLVVRATLSVTPTNWGEQPGKAHPFIADGVLKIWIRGESQSFDSIGACRAKGDGLICDGSLSAAEADTCKSGRDGVRQCRIGGGKIGSFQIDGKHQDVSVTIRDQLELVQAPYDGEPFLYFSATNAENHAFILNNTPDACR